MFNTQRSNCVVRTTGFEERTAYLDNYCQLPKNRCENRTKLLTFVTLMMYLPSETKTEFVKKVVDGEEIAPEKPVVDLYRTMHMYWDEIAKRYEDVHILPVALSSSCLITCRK